MFQLKQTGRQKMIAQMDSNNYRQTLCADVEHARARALPNAGARLYWKNKAESSSRKV